MNDGTTVKPEADSTRDELLRGRRQRPAPDGRASSSVDESRLAMMRRVKRLPVAERIALLDRICREQTRIVLGARRIR